VSKKAAVVVALARNDRHKIDEMIKLMGVLFAVLLLVADATTPTTRIFHLQCVRKHCSKKREASPIGSLLRFRRPTADRVSCWFSPDTSHNLNHDSAGMTNPCLHISLEEDDNDVMQVSAGDWWPASFNKKGWKLLRYRQRVGFGSACYDAVRDKALEWEFNDISRGIVQIHSCHREPILQRRESRGLGYDVIHNVAVSDGDLCGASTQNALKIWSGPGGRRLATFTQAGFKWKWAPRLYVVNPVEVIYDLVDQRAPGTTYSSTAYATARGHWLRGEERLSVFHRDGGDVDVEIVSYSKPQKSLWGRLIWPLVGPMQSQFFESQMNALQNAGVQLDDPNGAVQYSDSNGAPVVEVMNIKARRGEALNKGWITQ
jgi:uncharacterized protein (UPF0548 family)